MNINSVILGLIIFFSSFAIGLCIRNGLTRSAAISSGMSAYEYVNWMESVDNQ